MIRPSVGVNAQEALTIDRLQLTPYSLRYAPAFGRS